MIRNGQRTHRRRLGQSTQTQTPYNLVPDTVGETIQFNGNTYSWVNGQWVSPGQMSITPNAPVLTDNYNAACSPALPYTIAEGGTCYAQCPPGYSPTADYTCAGPYPTATPSPVATTPIIVTPAPVGPAPLTTPAPANYSAQEIAGSFNYTADLETVQNEMALYGDTWDNAQTIVNDLYSSGIVPGTVTPAIAFSMLTGLAADTATTAAPASLLSSVSTWPWYYWAAALGGGLLLFGSGSGRK